MARDHPNQSLSALLAESGWSAAELARAVNTLAGKQGVTLRYDRTSVAHWLSGSRPRSPVPDLVAAAFSNRTGRPVTAGETGLERPAAVPFTRIEPGDADAVLRLVALLRADVDPAHHAGLAAAAYQQAVAPQPVWRPASFTVPAARGPARITERAEVRTLEEMSVLFAGLADRHGGAHARSALALYLADDVGRVLSRQAPSAVRRQLLSGTAQLVHVLAVMTADAGYASLSQHYFHAALALAHDAGDRDVYSITLRAMSVQALRLGFRAQALRLVEEAMNAAGPDMEPATQAFLLNQRALARAHHRQDRAARADLEAAQAQHALATGPPGPFTMYTSAGLHYQAARTLLVLGRTHEAIHGWEISLLERTPDQRRTSALTLAALADTELGIGHLEAACQHWSTFLDLYPYLHSVRARQALVSLRRGLRIHHRHPQAAATLERARAALAVSSTRPVRNRPANP
ncbi:hypothetical protein GCM10010371_34460 [Streptomyces subrutilus]|uniref:Transcriptional regulator n=2 Tax=Streptomyces subrutilus TaxID=36818 RepID=A0A5P2UUL3_9ACTN|nr:hypothetical protein [Streptomyces subrutilus]QEU81925.1 hypothetical protein CP968_29835 [Streptomyces subrutilus]GGZ71876.1 hypothetical protein GCM10010371_34460 [Streptomyces subrutilus]